MSVLVIAEHDNQDLNPVTLNAVAAAAKLDGPIHILVAGKQASSVADAAAQVAGVEKVLLADGEALEHALAENLAKQVVAVAEPYQHIVFPSSTFGKNVAPRVAALLDEIGRASCRERGRGVVGVVREETQEERRA